MQTHVVVVLVLMLVGVATAAVGGYSVLCDSAFCRIVDDASKEISSLRVGIDEGNCLSAFGQKADQICNSALERFSSEAPLPDDDKTKEAIYDKRVEDLERALDAPLNVIYLKQLSLIREKALRNFKAGLNAEGSEYEAMMQADEFFRREAEESTRQVMQSCRGVLQFNATICNAAPMLKPTRCRHPTSLCPLSLLTLALCVPPLSLIFPHPMHSFTPLTEPRLGLHEGEPEP